MNKDKISFLKHDKEIIVDELLQVIKELEAQDSQIKELKRQLTLHGVGKRSELLSFLTWVGKNTPSFSVQKPKQIVDAYFKR